MQYERYAPKILLVSKPFWLRDVHLGHGHNSQTAHIHPLRSVCTQHERNRPRGFKDKLHFDSRYVEPYSSVLYITGLVILCINSVWNPSTESKIMALGSHVSESFLAYQLHSVVKMSGWKEELEPGKCQLN